MKFYGVHEGLYEGVSTRIEMFRSCCEAKGVEYVDIDSLAFDYTNVPDLGRDDLLYRLSRGSEMMMSLLLNAQVTSFYRKNPAVVTSSSTEWSIAHERAGIPSPRTVFTLSADRTLLKKYVEWLGGFPIVLKVAGGTRGIGTIKVDGWHGLLSTADFLMEIGAKFILREFIHATYGVRAIVVGDRVVASAKFFFQENDFRNAPILAATKYEPHQLDVIASEICVAAVSSIDLEMGGVDLLIDADGRPFLLEVNFPTGFQAFAPLEAHQIVGAMIDYLVTKASR